MAVIPLVFMLSTVAFDVSGEEVYQPHPVCGGENCSNPKHEEEHGVIEDWKAMSNKDCEGIEITVTEITENAAHNHCVCGKDNCDEHDFNSDEWTLITKAEDLSQMESGGYFYLGEDIELSKTIVIIRPPCCSLLERTYN